MYERKESGNSGAYYPAFLCMDVNTPDDLYYLGRKHPTPILAV